MTLFAAGTALNAQCSPGTKTSALHELYLQHKWQDVARLVPTSAPLDADDSFDLGMAYAHMRQWGSARSALLAGSRLCPDQKRFPIELAGIAFENKHYPEASSWLHRALTLDAKDNYVLDFSGTVYFLEGNLAAALKEWNPIQKPLIDALHFDSQLRVHRALLDRSFTFSPQSTLEGSQFLSTTTRLTSLGIFPVFRIELIAGSDGRFNAEFHAIERNGFGENRVSALLSTFGGTFYQTVFPAYYNAKRSATNVESLLRWDAQKRRALLLVSGPLNGLPQWRWQLMTDERNENWIIRRSFTGPAPGLAFLNLQRQVVSAKLSGLPHGTIQWSTGVEVSHRSYRNVDAGQALGPDLVAPGYQLKDLVSAGGTLVDLPERRFTIDCTASSEFARLWSQPARAYEKLRASALAHWFPQAEDDRYEAFHQVRAGHVFGRVPFDELYMLGIERDNDLWLRSLVGTRDGRKGSSPLGSSFILLNNDFDRRFYSNGLLKVRAGPWLDAGRAFAPTAALSTNEWLVGAGGEVRINLLGAGLVLTYGRDMRLGTNAFFITFSGGDHPAGTAASRLPIEP